MDEGIADRQGLLKFLAGRPFAYLADEEDEDEGEAENFVDTQLENLDKGCRHVGFNGRWNKKADTCYTWWTVGTLAVCLPRLLNPSQHHLSQTNKTITDAQGPLSSKH